MIPRLGTRVQFYQSTGPDRRTPDYSARNGQHATVMTHGGNPNFPENTPISVRFDNDEYIWVMTTELSRRDGVSFILGPVQPDLIEEIEKRLPKEES